MLAMDAQNPSDIHHALSSTSISNHDQQISIEHGEPLVNDDEHYWTTLQLIDWIVDLGSIHEIVSFKDEDTAEPFDRIQTNIYVYTPREDYKTCLTIVRFDDSCRVSYTLKSRIIKTWPECFLHESTLWKPLQHLIIDQPRVGMLWLIKKSIEHQTSIFTISRVPFHGNQDQKPTSNGSKNIDPWVVALMPFAYDHLKGRS